MAHPLDGYGMVVPKTEGLRTTALSFVSTKFPHRAPEGRVLLRGFLGGVRDPRCWRLTDEEMIETVKRDMHPVLGLRGQPVMGRVFRWPGGTPQLEVGHLERMAAVETDVAKVPGLHLTGAGIRSTGIPDSVADGTRAGESSGGGRATRPAASVCWPSWPWAPRYPSRRRLPAPATVSRPPSCTSRCSARPSTGRSPGGRKA